MTDGLEKVFNHTSYTLEIYDLLMKWGGSKTVAIPHDISDENLMNLLPQINGVLFSGVEFDFSDKDAEGLKYLRTAKKIYQYSKIMKDQRGEDWPILGISNGLETISLIINQESNQINDEHIPNGGL